jgi:hypothetical protein
MKENKILCHRSPSTVPEHQWNFTDQSTEAKNERNIESRGTSSGQLDIAAKPPACPTNTVPFNAVFGATSLTVTVGCRSSAPGTDDLRPDRSGTKQTSVRIPRNSAVII